MGRYNKYQKIWVEHHKTDIPKDEKGRSYHIHHKDRNRKNNNIDNLECIPVLEHYNIHYKAKEWTSCLILTKYLDDEEVSKEERSKLASLAAKTGKDCVFNRPEVRAKNLASMKKKIDNGTFHLQSGEIQRKNNAKLIAKGKFVFQRDDIKQKAGQRMKENGLKWYPTEKRSEDQKRRVKEGIHHLLSGEIQRKTNAKLVKEGKHSFQKLLTCEYCGFEGKGAGFRYNHGDYCRDNPNNGRIICPHCKTSCHPVVFKRYHGDNCKCLKLKIK